MMRGEAVKADSTLLSPAFKNYTGVSPRAFRKDGRSAVKISR